MEQTNCPVCEAACSRLVSKRGNFYWKCAANKNHVFFDENGKPGKNMNDREPVPCPVCKSLCFRQLSKNNRYYWRCGANSSHAFYDRNGTIGERFGKKISIYPVIFVLILIVAAFFLWKSFV